MDFSCTDLPAVRLDHVTCKCQQRFLILLHYRRQWRIILSLPSAQHSGMYRFPPPLFPAKEKPCFIVPVTPARSPCYKTPFSLVQPQQPCFVPLRPSVCFCHPEKSLWASLNSGCFSSCVSPEDPHCPRNVVLTISAILDCLPKYGPRGTGTAASSCSCWQTWGQKTGPV